jgi:hypothetical protein
MEITLPPEIERALKEQARQRGTTPEQLALDTLRQEFVSATPNGAESPAPVEGYANLAEFLDGFIGVIHSGEVVPGGARMSEATADTFAAALLEKRKQGRL